MAAAVAVGIAAQLTSSGFAFPVATIGAWLGVLLVIGGLIQGRGLMYPIGIVVLACLALVDLLYDRLTIVQAPLIGGALLGTAEFGYWSFEFEAGLTQTRRLILRRAGVIFGLVALGAGLSATLAILETF